MPKGTERPYNRAERKVVEGMKELRKKGLGRRRHLVPGAEGTAGGAGTFSPYESDRRSKRSADKKSYGGKMKKMAGGGMCRGMGAATKGGKFRIA